MGLDAFDFFLSFYTFHFVQLFFIFLCFKVFINSTFFEEFFHAGSSLKFLCYIYLWSLLSKASVIIRWIIRIFGWIINFLRTKWLLYLLQLKLSKLKTLLSFIKLLFCQFPLCLVRSILHKLLGFKSMLLGFLFLLDCLNNLWLSVCDVAI